MPHGFCNINQNLRYMSLEPYKNPNTNYWLIISEYIYRFISIFFFIGNLRVHIQKTHTVRTDQVDQLFRCAHCTCVFKKVSSLNAHVTRIHVNEKYPLDVDNVLENLIELEKITSKNIGSNEVLTNIGNDLSSNASNIEVAGKEDTTEDEDGVVNDIIFDDQGLRTMVTLSEVLNDGSLRKYLVRLKKSGDTRWYICNYCSKEFKKPSDLIRHIRVHTKEKPYKVS